MLSMKIIVYNVIVTYIDNIKENKCLHEDRLVLFMIQYEFQCHDVQVIHLV